MKRLTFPTLATLIFAAIIVVFAVFTQDAPAATRAGSEAIAHLEGRVTTTVSITNSTTRELSIDQIWLKTLTDTTTTNAFTISIINSQPAGSITYPVTTRSFTTSDVYTPTTFRWPNGAILVIANSAGTTNDYMIFRSEAE